jgi:hypothetical protein
MDMKMKLITMKTPRERSCNILTPLDSVLPRAVARQQEVACLRAVVETGAERVCRRVNAVVDPDDQIAHERGKVRALPGEESKCDVRLKHRENPARLAIGFPKHIRPRSEIERLALVGELGTVASAAVVQIDRARQQKEGVPGNSQRLYGSQVTIMFSDSVWPWSADFCRDSD